MKTILIRKSFALAAAALAAYGVHAAASTAAVAFRFDDNHTPDDWRAVAEAFKAENVRCSFAVVSGGLSDEQGACLKALSDDGFEIMDHTAAHAVYVAQWLKETDYVAACAGMDRNAAWFGSANASARKVRFEPEIDLGHAKNVRFTGHVTDGALFCDDTTVAAQLTFSKKIWIPSKAALFGVVSTAADGGRKLREFYGETDQTFDLADEEMVLVDQIAIQPAPDVLRIQARATRANFAAFGLPAPKTWIQPGGWEAFVDANRVKAVYGGEFGYTGADCVMPKERCWYATDDDTPAELVPWMQRPSFFYFDEGATYEEVIAQIQKAQALGKPLVFISHMSWGKAGGREKWIDLTRRVLQWMKEADVPALTEATLTQTFYGGAAESAPVASVPSAPDTAVRVTDGVREFTESSGVFLTNGDLELSTARLKYRPAGGTGEADLAREGMLVYGGDANIEAEGSSVALRLGLLSRSSQGGTLALRTPGGLDALGGSVRFEANGFADGEQLPATVIGGSVPSAAQNEFGFLTYSTGRGLVPVTLVEGLAGGETANARLTAETTLTESTRVRSLTIDGGSLKMSGGVTLTVGDGTNPGGVIFKYPLAESGDQPARMADGGEIDFGAEGVIWAASADKETYVDFGSTKLTSAGGMTFAGRAGSQSWKTLYWPNCANVGWKGPTYVEGCVLDLRDTADILPAGQDVYVRGNSEYGACLKLTGAGGTTFGGRVYFTGPGFWGRTSPAETETSWAKMVSFFSNGSGWIDFNGPVTIENEVQFMGDTEWSGAKFNQTIDGNGSLIFPFTGQFWLNAANTYTGATEIHTNAIVHVCGPGTLGRGEVRTWRGGTLSFENCGTNGVDNVFTGTGTLEVQGSTLVFSNEVAFGETKLAAGSTLVLGGVSNDLGRLVLPVGAKITALAGRAAVVSFTAEADGDVAGTIENGEGALTVVKRGAGSLTVGSAALAGLAIEAGTVRFLNPLAGDGLSWWLDAAQSNTLTVANGTVSRWVSRGKDGTVFAMAHDLPGPKRTRTLTGKDVVSFEGSKNQRLVATTQTVNRTVFVVDVPRDLDVAAGLFGKDWEDVGQRYESWTNTATWAWKSGTHTFAQGDYIRIDGVRFDKDHNRDGQPLVKDVTQVLTFEHLFDNGNSVATFKPSIGGYYAEDGNAARSFDGDIAEMLSFDRILDTAERELVEDYLAKKWKGAVIHGTEPFDPGQKIALAEGAVLDLNGFSGTIGELTGSGTLVNSSGIPVRLVVKNGRKFKGVAVGDNIELVLRGLGFAISIR